MRASVFPPDALRSLRDSLLAQYYTNRAMGLFEEAARREAVLWVAQRKGMPRQRLADILSCALGEDSSWLARTGNL